MSHNGKLLTQIMNKLDKPTRVRTPKNQWQTPGQVTPIDSYNITMGGVGFDAIGMSPGGFMQYMQNGQDYSFPTKPVVEVPLMKGGGQHGGLDRWFAEKWVDVKTGKACGRQEGEKRRSYPACRPSRRVSEDTPKTASELSPAEREKFKRSKTSSERINYQHRRKEDGGEINESDMANKPNNPSLWSRAKAEAKKRFDVYPSAYANGWAAKWYKSKGGTWRKAEYGMEVPMMEEGGKPEWLLEAQLKAQGFSGPALQQKMASMAQGGEPQNEGFQALPEYVQAKILANMGYGGYIPEMAYGGIPQQAAIDRLQRREERLVAKGYKAVDEGREKKADRILGRAARVEDRKIRLMDNMAYGGMAYPFMQDGGEEVYIPQSLEELMAPNRRGAANLGFGFNNDKFSTNYNYSGSDNLKNGTHSLNISLPAFLKTGSLDVSGNYSPGRSYGASVAGTAPANFIKKGAMMNFSGGYEKDINPMMKGASPSYNLGAGLNIPTRAGNFTINASYRKEKGGQTMYPYMQQGGEPDGEMALGQINAALDKLERLRQFIQPDSNLEPWVSSKLTMMDHYADAVSDYMMYNPEAQEMAAMMGEDPEASGMPEMKNGGGIPERYRKMGFSKVGVKKESTRPGKKWMVLAKKGNDYKVVHGGYDGMKDFSQHGSEKRKERFWDRMGGKNSAKAKDPFSPLYWHKRFGTWEQGGEIPEMKKGGSTWSGNTWYEMGGSAYPFAELPMMPGGGLVEGAEMEVTPEQAEYLRSQGIDFEII